MTNTVKLEASINSQYAEQFQITTYGTNLERTSMVVPPQVIQNEGIQPRAATGLPCAGTTHKKKHFVPTGRCTISPGI